MSTPRMLFGAAILLAVLLAALFLYSPRPVLPPVGTPAPSVTVTSSASPTPGSPNPTFSASPTVLVTFAPVKATAPPTNTQP